MLAIIVPASNKWKVYAIEEVEQGIGGRGTEEWERTAKEGLHMQTLHLGLRCFITVAQDQPCCANYGAAIDEDFHFACPRHGTNATPQFMSTHEF